MTYYCKAHFTLKTISAHHCLTRWYSICQLVGVRIACHLQLIKSVILSLFSVIGYHSVVCLFQIMGVLLNTLFNGYFCLSSMLFKTVFLLSVHYCLVDYFSFQQNGNKINSIDIYYSLHLFFHYLWSINSVLWKKHFLPSWLVLFIWNASFSLSNH